jgi:hypothetical protein
MIRINRPEEIPEILQTKGKAKERGMKSAFTRFESDYRSGAKKFEFDNKIYGHETVKKVLRTAQKDKCFLCESKVSHISHGDVEHFRPKAGYRQSADKDLQKPGYYWLAYEWENLFFACQLCNQRFKKNLFPLADETHRATSHKDDYKREQPLFINPAEENPEDFISYRGEYVFAIDDNQRGEATYKGAGLDRVELEEFRRTYLEEMRALYNVAIASPELPQSKEALELLQQRTTENYQYSVMLKAALKDKFSF